MNLGNPEAGDKQALAAMPEDVSALYSWANLPAEKYRDFSASRRELRAQTRQRAAQMRQERDLQAQATAEYAAAAAEHAAAAARSAALLQNTSDNQELRLQAIHREEEAEATASAEHKQAACRAEAAADAAEAVLREEREIVEAQASVKFEALRTAQVESAKPESSPSQAEPVHTAQTAPQSPWWRKFESAQSIPLRALRLSIFAGGIMFFCFAGALYLTWPQQLVLALLTLFIALWLHRSSSSYLVSLTLIVLSIFSTFRYAFWRISSVIAFFHDPGTHWTALDAFFVWILLLAECYAFLVLLLGYVQMLWPLRRMPVPMPDDIEQWPAVDLVIPTYNEPLSVVRYTALAAMNIDWPADKLHVYLLDDGRREEFRAFAEEAGIGYRTRDDNRHAKAGNINRALEHLDSPFLAIFDCDHVPTRSFLQLTMGWFQRDPKLAMLQTPHHFYSPDPFERNLDQFQITPNEGELFYGVVQDCNDFWNASFFCGSCAVIRRCALDEVGGIAVETVTEDAHTSLRLQIKGWNTAYINIPQAAGLATERLSAHVKQRIRWARGMVQILHIENPLFAPGLKPAQRLCYFNAMSHFLYALPRLIFLTAPLIYLIFGHSNIPGYWAMILAYAAPHLVLSSVTNSRIQGQHRHSFWNEIYETVLSPYIFLPTMLALFSTRLGNFNVTAKGGVVDEHFFDKRIARPFLVLLTFNLFGLLCAIARFFQFPTFDVPTWLSFLNWPASIYDGNRSGTILMNVLWTLFSIVLLGVATAVAWESQQRRQTVRMERAVPSDILLRDGSLVQGITSDLSTGGVRTRMHGAINAEVGDAIQCVFRALDGTATLPATVIAIDGEILRAQFDSLNLMQEEALATILYSRADTWLSKGEARESDHPLRSLACILRLSVHGLSQTVRSLLRHKPAPAKNRLEASVATITSTASILLLVLLIGLSPRNARAARAANLPSATSVSPRAASSPASVSVRTTHPATFDNVFTLGDLGAPEAILLRGTDAVRTINFSISPNQIVNSATMRLRYHLSPGLLPGVSSLKVSLNGTLIATLAVNAPANSTQQNAPLDDTIPLPANLLAHDNRLTFEFIGHYTTQCEDPLHTTLWSQIDSDTSIELAGSLQPLPNQLSLLPLPFYDSALNLHPVVPIVFLSQPSPQAMRAAGIVASWFGILADDHPVRFPVSIGSIPSGNAIVIAERASEIPASLDLATASGPTLGMRDNPSDPSSKILLIAGNNADDLVQAATALALQRDLLQGAQVRIPSLRMPAPRQPDDAPRWLRTDKNIDLGDISQTVELQGDGSQPVTINLRIPPDLYYGQTRNLAFHLSYRYNGVPLGNDSTLQVFVNGAFVSSTPMPHSSNASEALETIIPIPVSDLRPFSNLIQLQFAFQIARQEPCQSTPPLNLQGAILKDSALDLADTLHWAVLPNLQLFANAGFPFTRKANLADTSVVLPDQPIASELEMFLALMGHFGAQTGYPVLNVSVTNANGMTEAAHKDYLVMGTVNDQPALRMLNAALPVGIDETGLHIQDTQGFFDLAQNAWWRVRSSDHVQSGEIETIGGLPDALIEGIEWPRGSARSIVVIVVRDPSATQNFISGFLESAPGSDISQSVSVLRDTRFSSYRIGNDDYRVGYVPLLTRIAMLLTQFPWLIVLLAVVFSALMATLIHAMLRQHARARTGSERPKYIARDEA